MPGTSKGDGEPLKVPDVVSEVVRRVFLGILRPVYRTEFRGRSCNFEPGHSARRTMTEIRRLVGENGRCCAISVSVGNFFSGIGRSLLLGRV